MKKGKAKLARDARVGKSGVDQVHAARCLALFADGFEHVWRGGIGNASKVDLKNVGSWRIRTEERKFRYRPICGRCTVVP